MLDSLSGTIWWFRIKCLGLATVPEPHLEQNFFALAPRKELGTTFKIHDPVLSFSFKLQQFCEVILDGNIKGTIKEIIGKLMLIKIYKLKNKISIPQIKLLRE